MVHRDIQISLLPEERMFVIGCVVEDQKWESRKENTGGKVDRREFEIKFPKLTMTAFTEIDLQLKHTHISSKLPFKPVPRIPAAALFCLDVVTQTTNKFLGL